MAKEVVVRLWFDDAVSNEVIESSVRDVMGLVCGVSEVSIIDRPQERAKGVSHVVELGKKKYVVTPVEPINMDRTHR